MGIDKESVVIHELYENEIDTSPVHLTVCKKENVGNEQLQILIKIFFNYFR